MPEDRGINPEEIGLELSHTPEVHNQSQLLAQLDHTTKSFFGDGNHNELQKNVPFADIIAVIEKGKEAGISREQLIDKVLPVFTDRWEMIRPQKETTNGYVSDEEELEYQFAILADLIEALDLQPEDIQDFTSTTAWGEEIRIPDRLKTKIEHLAPTLFNEVYFKHYDNEIQYYKKIQSARQIPIYNRQIFENRLRVCNALRKIGYTPKNQGSGTANRNDVVSAASWGINEDLAMITALDDTEYDVHRYLDEVAASKIQLLRALGAEPITPSDSFISWKGHIFRDLAREHNIKNFFASEFERQSTDYLEEEENGLKKLATYAMFCKANNLSEDFTLYQPKIRSNYANDEDYSFGTKDLIAQAIQNANKPLSNYANSKLNEHLLEYMEQQAKHYGLEKEYQEELLDALREEAIALISKGAVFDTPGTFDALFDKKFPHYKPLIINKEFLASDAVLTAAVEGALSMYGRHHADEQDFVAAEKILQRFNPPVEKMQAIFKAKLEAGELTGIMSMAKQKSECGGIYHQYIADKKAIAHNSELDFFDRHKATDALVMLATSGETALIKESIETIVELSTAKETSATPLGINPIQETAYNLLFKASNKDGDAALFSLVLNPHLTEKLKKLTLANLTSDRSSFLNRSARLALQRWMRHRTETGITDWNDLRFIQTMRDTIASTDLRDKSTQLVGEAYGYAVLRHNESLASVYSSYPNIPENAFLQAYALAEGNKEVLQKLHDAYASIKKEGRIQEGMLFGIVNCNEINPKLKTLFLATLTQLPITDKQDSIALVKLMKQFFFLDATERMKRDDQYMIAFQQEIGTKTSYDVSSDIAKLLEQSNLTCTTLQEQLEILTTKKLQESLPHPDITPEKIQTIMDTWGDIEPILTYIGRYPGMKEFIAEIVAHIDTEKQWKAWRYNTDEYEIQSQVGRLTDEQLEVWKGDYIAPIGSLEIGESTADKPKNIRKTLADAIVMHKHICNPERGETTNKLLQNNLEHVFKQIADKPELEELIITEALGNTIKDLELLSEYSGIVDDLPQLRKLHQHVQKWREGEERKALTREKHGIDLATIESEINHLQQKTKSVTQQTELYLQRLGVLRKEYGGKTNGLPTDQVQEINQQRIQEEERLGKELLGEQYEEHVKNYKRLGLLKNNLPNPLDEKTQQLLQKYELSATSSNEEIDSIVEKTQARYNELQGHDIVAQYGLDPNNKNLQPLIRVTEQLRIQRDILKISQLTPEMIANNRFIVDKLQGETISDTIDSLQRFFGTGPLTQDLENVKTILKRESDIGKRANIGIIITDNPQMLWQVGKYPLGNGSCQNYASGGHADHLAGYISDANVKVAFLFDFNKLPAETIQELEQKGMDHAINIIPPQLLLDASVARSIIKLGYDNYDNPTLVLEPTYTSVNKDDQSMDRIFELGIHQLMAADMEIQMARQKPGDKLISVSLGQSRSPEGQYEDSNLDELQIVTGLPPKPKVTRWTFESKDDEPKKLNYSLEDLVRKYNSS